MQSSAPSPGAPSPWDSVLGAIEDSISQCTFLQMTYTAEPPYADGITSPGARPHFRPPRHRDPHTTSPTPTTTGCLEDKCPVISKQPLHSRYAAKISPHILIGPESVLTVHAPSPPAAGSHCPAREDSAPHCRTEFSLQSLERLLAAERKFFEDRMTAAKIPAPKKATSAKKAPAKKPAGSQ
jgi:hypothetical protein